MRLRAETQARSEAQAEAADASGRCTELLRDLSSLRVQLATAEARAVQLDTRLQALHARGADTTPSAADPPDLLVRQLRKDLAARDEEIAEARRIKAHQQSIERLREELRSAESKAQRAEDLGRQLAAAEAAASELREEAARWRRVFDGTPEDLAVRLGEVQRASAVQQAREAALAAEGARAAARVRELEAAAAIASARVAELEQQAADAVAVAARTERRLALLTKERDGLKLIVASYDAEEAKVTQGADPSLPSPFAGQLTVRVRELEAQLASQAAASLQLETELRAVTATATDLRGQLESETKKSAALSVQLRAQEKELEDLGREAAGLRDRLGRGDYDPTTTKVLHLTMNPERDAREAAYRAREEELAAENAALKTQVQRLEEAMVQLPVPQLGAVPPPATPLGGASLLSLGFGGGGAAPTPMVPGTVGVGVEVAMLEARARIYLNCRSFLSRFCLMNLLFLLLLRSDVDSWIYIHLHSAKNMRTFPAQASKAELRVRELERREVRLKEVFKERIDAFREACYFLFGYRVDMMSEATVMGAGVGTAPTTFILHPAHAPDSRAILHFRFAANGKGMELIPNEFTQQEPIRKQVEIFVHRMRSIAAFTANLTVDYFNAQTLC